MKTVPLITAILKSFIRNWKSIVLLTVIPLMIIVVFFGSFNTEGILGIPIGITGLSDRFNIKDYESSYFSYLKITEFQSKDACISELKAYKQYACLEVIYGDAVTLNVYYDNTRNAIIWEVLERIKTSIDILQKLKSKEIASDFLTKFNSALSKLLTFKGSLRQTSSNLGGYINEIDNSILSLSNAKNDLANTINSMDQDIADAKSTKSDLQNDKDEFYSEASSSIRQSKQALMGMSNLTYWQYSSWNSAMSQLNLVDSLINSYNNQANAKFYDFDQRIWTYEESSRRGKGYMGDIDTYSGSLSNTKGDLVNYRTEIDAANDEIDRIYKDFEPLMGVSPDTLVNPIVMLNSPVYVPTHDMPKPRNNTSNTPNDATVREVIKGVNLIGLQTLFPTILFLIIIFLSLLISSFISLNEINSPSIKRVSLVRGIFFPHILAIFISSMLIMLLPLLAVLAMGDVLFKLPILEHLTLVLGTLLLVSSVFVLLGMFLAYLVRKESITLMINTFLLVLIIFYSGFLLPIEKMSGFAHLFANIFPGKLALDAFFKLVFYEQGIAAISNEIVMLLTWIGVLAIGVIVVAGLRRYASE